MADALRPYAFVALVTVVSLAHGWWRRGQARAHVERWAAQHRYRVLTIRMPLLGIPPFFRNRLMRRDGHAFKFRLVVDDQRLGGRGVLWVRSRVDWIGGPLEIDPADDVAWVEMPAPAGAGADPAELRWADRQMALLRRVADGESVFRPESRDAAAATAFDEQVEHLLALQRRGLITCGTPIAELRGDGQYAAVTDAAITEDGRRALARATPASGAAI